MSPERDPSATRSLAPAVAPGNGERWYALVIDADSSSVFHLPSTGVVLIGRTGEVDLPLGDGACSRRHARLLLSDGQVRVADLGSRNGTRVNGTVVEGTRELAAGDVITIGDAALILRRGRRPQSPRPLVDASGLHAHLGDEVARAIAFGRPLAVLALSVPRASGSLGQLTHFAREELRAMDLAALVDDRVVVVLPEVTDGEAEARAARLLVALAAIAPQAAAGVAACPADGCEPGALIDAARAAVDAAAPGEVVRAGNVVAELCLDDRRILVADGAMLRIYDLLRRLAASPVPVLIIGETGVGKENAAFAIHHWSRRVGKPFVTLNCAALQETLAESELFGHERGAFSGATAPKPGLLESADGGTVFLDEVGEIPASIQAKLLRALETQRITRVGSVRERAIDIRLVAATNRNLEEEVEAGRFRRDLFFRLCAATVLLPPLRERSRELPLLARRFLDAACARADRERLTISAAAMFCLAAHGWPGNVRELKNTMEVAAATVPGSLLEPRHLPESMRGDGEPSGASAARSEPAMAPLPPPAPTTFQPIAEELLDLERTRMLQALDAADWVQKRAAQLLQMPLRTFGLKYRRYGLGSRTRKRS